MKCKSVTFHLSACRTFRPLWHGTLTVAASGVMQVNRLELTLSMAGFAAGIGAMIAGIFGMNLKSTLEESIIGFWGTTAAIVLGCFWIFVALYRYTCRRRIL